MKYKIRRVVFALILVGLLTIFTSIALQKGIDAQIQQDKVMWENHMKVHEIKQGDWLRVSPDQEND